MLKKGRRIRDVPLYPYVVNSDIYPYLRYPDISLPNPPIFVEQSLFQFGKEEGDRGLGVHLNDSLAGSVRERRRRQKI